MIRIRSLLKQLTLMTFQRVGLELSLAPPNHSWRDRFMLGMGGESMNLYQLVIGIGAWLGTILLFHVWVLIWPNQKKILDLVPPTDEQKATARKTTLYATRTNFILSAPLLLCMGTAGHDLPF